MHEYLMEVERWFGGHYRFQVLAYSKEHAMMSGKMYLTSTEPNYSNEYHMDTLKVVRKMKPSFGQ